MRRRVWAAGAAAALAVGTAVVAQMPTSSAQPSVSQRIANGSLRPAYLKVAAGLINMELNRGDGSLGTFHAVQAGLAMRSIWMLGSEEQKQRWLPPMARLEKLGAFALTEAPQRRHDLRDSARERGASSRGNQEES